MDKHDLVGRASSLIADTPNTNKFFWAKVVAKYSKVISIAVCYAVLDKDGLFWPKTAFLVEMLKPTCELIKAVQTDKANLAGVPYLYIVCIYG